MKVLQMGPYPPPHGGVQTNLVAIRRFLLARGIPCAVINLTRYRSADGDEIYYPKNPLEVLKLLTRLQYDIIHLHFGGNLTPRLMMLALACCLMPRSKTVLTFHSGGYPLSEAGKSANPLTFRGFVLRRFNRVIGVNRELDKLFRRFGVAERQIRLIYPHAISLDSAEETLPNPLAPFFQTRHPTLLTVSGLEPEYDLSLQIDVLGRLRERFPDAGLVIIGSGSLEAEVRARIQSKPYAEHILLCGDVPHSVTLRAIAESDLFLRTTLYDGDSISVREALLIGTPVIATDNGMRPAGTRLIPCSDPDALRRTIEQVLAENAPERTQGDTGERNIEEVFELYQELLKEMK
ncbi:MAG: glycosyltransferase family 4 protein [Blastocatellia bacterium]